MPFNYFFSLFYYCGYIMLYVNVYVAGWREFFGVGGATRINPKGEGVVHTPELNAMVAGQIPVLNAMAAGQDPCT
jgi:hypothetical protein